MSVLRLAAKALRMPPRELARKLRTRLDRWRAERAERSRDLRAGTWETDPSPGPLQWRLRELPLPQRAAEELATIAEVCRRHLDHRYDLLGSGWIRWQHGTACPGLLGHRFPPGPAVAANPDGAWLSGQVPASCLAGSRKLWRLVSPGYRPHDWQLDARSGFRWSTTTWHRDIRYGHVLGADVKLPWELARMQHLPLLAQAYAHAKRGDPGGWEPAERYLREVQDQILDFCAANPPRFGVNWACTMDVAIRVANWLLALDALHAAGAAFDQPFLDAVATAVRAHGRFIASHLEWDPVARGNHYLADLAGLAWAGAWLPADGETDGWLALAQRELAAETQRLFQADGTYGEASTAYHCLALETTIAGTLALAGLPHARRARLPKDAFPARHWRALARAGAAIRDFAVPDGGIALIGDDDSGRFFRWRPAYRLITGVDAHARYLDLDPEIDPPDQLFPDLDHRDKRALAGAVLGWSLAPDLAAWTAIQGIDESALATALGDAGLPQTATHDPSGGPAPDDSNAETDFLRTWASAPPALRQELNIPVPPGPPLTDSLEFRSYPDLGLWIWRSPRLVLLIRCGPDGLPGLNGHAHLDQLALELHLDGQPRFRDPGSFLYTPLRSERRRHRGSSSHRVPAPVATINPSEPFTGVHSEGCRLHTTKGSFIGRNGTPPNAVFRWVIIGAHEIIIRDLHASSDGGLGAPTPPAVAYGRRLRTTS